LLYLNIYQNVELIKAANRGKNALHPLMAVPIAAGVYKALHKDTDLPE
jgi:hypothetical protein